MGNAVAHISLIISDVTMLVGLLQDKLCRDVWLPIVLANARTVPMVYYINI